MPQGQPRLSWLRVLGIASLREIVVLRTFIHDVRPLQAADELSVTTQSTTAARTRILNPRFLMNIPCIQCVESVWNQRLRASGCGHAASDPAQDSTKSPGEPILDHRGRHGSRRDPGIGALLSYRCPQQQDCQQEWHLRRAGASPREWQVGHAND